MADHRTSSPTVERRCEYCGTPVDESDYQDDGYRHTDGRCVEYLKAALGAANREAAELRASLAKAHALWSQDTAALDAIRRMRCKNADYYEPRDICTCCDAVAEILEPLR